MATYEDQRRAYDLALEDGKHWEVLLPVERYAYLKKVCKSDPDIGGPGGFSYFTDGTNTAKQITP